MSNPKSSKRFNSTFYYLFIAVTICVITLCYLYDVIKPLYPEKITYFSNTLSNTTYTEKITYVSNISYPVIFLDTNTTNSDAYTYVNNLARDIITRAQEPSDCSSVKYLVCDSQQKGCGFGCLLHFFSGCLDYAIKNHYTAILPNSNFVNWGSDPWTDTFIEISTCQQHPSRKRKGVKYSPDMVPTYWVPSDLLIKLKQLNHVDPAVFWIGHIMDYLIKYNNRMKTLIDNTIKELNMSTHNMPDIGIHIRRTDKITSREAKYHNVTRYLREAEELLSPLFHNHYQRDDKKISVYIASDDENVIKELSPYTSKFKFFYNIDGATIAHYNRYSRNSRDLFFVDLEILTRCKYFVGTFSSQVSRVVYELLSARKFKAMDYVHSLDDGWFQT